MSCWTRAGGEFQYFENDIESIPVAVSSPMAAHTNTFPQLPHAEENIRGGDEFQKQHSAAGENGAAELLRCNTVCKCPNEVFWFCCEESSNWRSLQQASWLSGNSNSGLPALCPALYWLYRHEVYHRGEVCSRAMRYDGALAHRGCMSLSINY